MNFSTSLLNQPIIEEEDGGSPPSSTEPLTPNQSSGSQNNTRQARPFDIVIFGASGSVGRFLVEETALVIEKFFLMQGRGDKELSSYLRAKSLQSNKSSLEETSDCQGRNPLQFAQKRNVSMPRQLNSIRWAIAGRSAVKLSQVLDQTELSTGIKDLSTQIPVLLADLNHEKSLENICQQTEVIINCAGPYSIESEALIRTCIETRTHYLDLSHENLFVERIRRRYNEAAREAEIFIINGCGFQSMSAEMGLNFIKQFADGRVDEVKIITNLSSLNAILQSGSEASKKEVGIITNSMWSSLLLDKSLDQNSSSRFETPRNSTDIDAHNQLGRKDTQSLVREIVSLQNNDNLTWFQLFRGFGSTGRRFCMPINALNIDEAQLIRGEMESYEFNRPDLSSKVGWRPIRCSSFISLKTLGQFIFFFLWLTLFSIFVKFSILRRLMRRFPSASTFGIVSKKELSRSVQRSSVSHIKYCQTFVVYGSPGDESQDPIESRTLGVSQPSSLLLVSRVVGPEPNYVATATFAIQAAIAVIIERDSMPRFGGVLTPGFALSETNIIHQLRRRGIKFEVIKKA